MMHYRKGDNIEKEITKEQLPFEDCMPATAAQGPKDFLWMHVKGGTKLPNVISYAKNALDTGEYRAVVWSGSGGGVIKTISCAEILKRSYPLYQVTRMCYQTVEEQWKPLMDGLEEIVAERQIPCLHILMSLDVIDDSVSGLQKPNTKTDFWVYEDANHSNNSGGRHSGPSRSVGSGQNQQRQQQRRPPPKQRSQPQQEQPQNQQEQQKDTPPPNQNQKRKRRSNKPNPQQEAERAAAPATSVSMET